MELLHMNVSVSTIFVNLPLSMRMGEVGIVRDYDIASVHVPFSVALVVAVSVIHSSQEIF